MMLSDYDRKDLTRDEQIVMATLRMMGVRGTKQMKKAAKEVAARFATDETFTALVSDIDIPVTNLTKNPEDTTE
jgi:hypothetical protein